MHDARTTLANIQRLWPELDAVPAPHRRNIPREQTPEQREAARRRWEDEITDKLAGAIGRGASPAPADLDQLQTRITLDDALCDLADRVARHVQPPAPPTEAWWRWRVSLVKGVPSRWRVETTPGDPSRWDYTHTHGAPWALTWLLGALEHGLPLLVVDDITATARDIHRRLEIAIDRQRTRNAGHCTCGAPLTVADWDTVITCPNCRTAHGRRDWLKLRDALQNRIGA